MNKEKLELRMYGLVPYNISSIQQGIQFGHSIDEMSLSVIDIMMKGFPVDARFYDWLRNWKTYIILNGGTTNSDPERLGTLNQHFDTLVKMGVDFSYFREPDLGDQLTSITFIVDERVFNKEDYPSFKDFFINKYGVLHYRDETKRRKVSYLSESEFFNLDYPEWEVLIGGEKNVKLREFLHQFRKA